MTSHFFAKSVLGLSLIPLAPLLLSSCGTTREDTQLANHTVGFEVANSYVSDNEECRPGEAAIGANKEIPGRIRIICGTVSYETEGHSAPLRYGESFRVFNDILCSFDSIATGFGTYLGGTYHYCAEATVTVGNFRYRLYFNTSEVEIVEFDSGATEALCAVSEGMLPVGNLENGIIRCGFVTLGQI